MRERVRESPIEERLQEALAIWVVTVAEIGRRSESAREWQLRVESDPPVDLTSAWKRLHGDPRS